MEIWRGGLLECVHQAHAVICDAKGVVAAWGNPQAVIFPRSSAKMMQALPLIETGAAAARGLSQAHLALVLRQPSRRACPCRPCRAAGWPTSALANPTCAAARMNRATCTERNRLIETHEKPCQLHNNCSGKHSGLPDRDPAPEGRAGICGNRPSAAKGDPRRDRGGHGRDRGGLGRRRLLGPELRDDAWKAWPARWRNLPPPAKATAHARMRCSG
jgi:hypothetical protein